jgi:hypothetical protein
MPQQYQPFLGNFATYGQGPEHDFFLEGLLTGDELLNTDPTVPPGSNPYDGTGYNEGSPGAPGGGMAGLGISDPDTDPTADKSRTTTNNPNDLLGFGVVGGLLGLGNELANLGIDRDITGYGLTDVNSADLGFGSTGMGGMGADLGFGGDNEGRGGGPGGPAGAGPGPGSPDNEGRGGGPGAPDGTGGGVGSDGGIGGGGGPDGGVDGGGPGGSGTGGQADGGLIRRYGMGGYVPGDRGGMDDSVPAAIDGMQPAALSSGEYVIDAATVALLGDGNSAAGAKKLDQLRDMVRKQATGSTKQPRKQTKTLASMVDKIR